MSQASGTRTRRPARPRARRGYAPRRPPRPPSQRTPPMGLPPRPQGSLAPLRPVAHSPAPRCPHAPPQPPVWLSRRAPGDPGGPAPRRAPSLVPRALSGGRRRGPSREDVPAASSGCRSSRAPSPGSETSLGSGSLHRRHDEGEWRRLARAAARVPWPRVAGWPG